MNTQFQEWKSALLDLLETGCQLTANFGTWIAAKKEKGGETK